jgi:hypothetical protein
MHFGLHLNTSSVNLTLLHGLEASSPISTRMYLTEIITAAMMKAIPPRRSNVSHVSRYTGYQCKHMRMVHICWCCTNS